MKLSAKKLSRILLRNYSGKSNANFPEISGRILQEISGLTTLNCVSIFFTNGGVTIWNSLPGHVVGANSINTLKDHLDNHWCMQDIMYDSESELNGIGNRSFQ